MDALSKLQLQHLPELRSLSSECGWLKSKFGLFEKKDLLSSETRLIQFASIVESLIEQIESLPREGNNNEYLRGLEIKISQTILPVREKLRERLREAKFYDSAQFPSSAAEIVPASNYGESKQSIMKEVSATENYYGNLNTAPVFPEMCSKSTSALINRIQRNYSANDTTAVGSGNMDFNHNNSSDCFDTPKLPTPQSFFESQQSPKFNIVFNKEPIPSSTTATTTTTKKSRAKNTKTNNNNAIKNSPKSVAMVRSISASNSSVFSEGYTTSSSHNSDNDTLSTGCAYHYNNNNNGYHHNGLNSHQLHNSTSIHSQLSTSRLSDNSIHCDGNNDSFLAACERGFIDTIGDKSKNTSTVSFTSAFTNTTTNNISNNNNNNSTMNTTQNSPLTHATNHSAATGITTTTAVSDLTRHHSVDDFMAGFGLACETQDFSHVNSLSTSNNNNNNNNTSHLYNNSNNNTNMNMINATKSNINNNVSANTLMSSPVHEDNHIFGTDYIMNSLNSEFHPCTAMTGVNGMSGILAGMSSIGNGSSIIPNEFCTEYQYLGLYDSSHSSPLIGTGSSTMSTAVVAAADVAAEFDQFGESVLHQQQLKDNSGVNMNIAGGNMNTNANGMNFGNNNNNMTAKYNNNNYLPTSTINNIATATTNNNINNYSMKYLLPNNTNMNSAITTASIIASTSGKDKRKMMDSDTDSSYGHNNSMNSNINGNYQNGNNNSNNTCNNNGETNSVMSGNNNNVTTFNDDEFRMSSRRRRRLSQIVPNPRKPRTADFSCSVCNELYQKVCEENPWWAVYHHECPKCHSIQVPRIDIGMVSNAIEVDPNVVALYGEGIDDGECEGYENYGIYEDDEEGVMVDDEYDEVDDNATVSGSNNIGMGNNNSVSGSGSMGNNNGSGINGSGVNTNNANNNNSSANVVVDDVKDSHPFYGEGLLSTEQASKLLVLMSHARSCSGIHTSPKHAEICRSTKFLMLHIRDCSGIDINGRSCRFTWCSPCKKMLRHLTRCFDPVSCNVCNTYTLPDSYCQLSKTNKVRAPAVSIAKEKLIYTSKLESRDALAFKFEMRKQQEMAAVASAVATGGNSSNNNMNVSSSIGTNVMAKGTTNFNTPTTMDVVPTANNNNSSMVEFKVEPLQQASSLPQHQLLSHVPLPVYSSTNTNYFAIDV